MGAAVRVGSSPVPTESSPSECTSPSPFHAPLANEIAGVYERLRALDPHAPPLEQLTTNQSYHCPPNDRDTSRGDSGVKVLLPSAMVQEGWLGRLLKLSHGQMLQRARDESRRRQGKAKAERFGRAAALLGRWLARLRWGARKGNSTIPSMCQLEQQNDPSSNTNRSITFQVCGLKSRVDCFPHQCDGLIHTHPLACNTNVGRCGLVGAYPHFGGGEDPGLACTGEGVGRHCVKNGRYGVSFSLLMECEPMHSWPASQAAPSLIQRSQSVMRDVKSHRSQHTSYIKTRRGIGLRADRDQQLLLLYLFRALLLHKQRQRRGHRYHTRVPTALAQAAQSTALNTSHTAPPTPNQPANHAPTDAQQPLPANDKAPPALKSQEGTRHTETQVPPPQTPSEEQKPSDKDLTPRDMSQPPPQPQPKTGGEWIPIHATTDQGKNAPARQEDSVSKPSPSSPPSPLPLPSSACRWIAASFEATAATALADLMRSQDVSATDLSVMQMRQRGEAGGGVSIIDVFLATAARRRSDVKGVLLPLASPEGRATLLAKVREAVKVSIGRMTTAPSVDDFSNTLKIIRIENVTLVPPAVSADSPPISLLQSSTGGFFDQPILSSLSNALSLSAGTTRSRNPYTQETSPLVAPCKGCAPSTRLTASYDAEADQDAGMYTENPSGIELLTLGEKPAESRPQPVSFIEETSTVGPSVRDRRNDEVEGDSEEEVDILQRGSELDPPPEEMPMHNLHNEDIPLTSLIMPSKPVPEKGKEGEGWIAIEKSTPPTPPPVPPQRETEKKTIAAADLPAHLHKKEAPPSVTFRYPSAGGALFEFVDTKAGGDKGTTVSRPCCVFKASKQLQWSPFDETTRSAAEKTQKKCNGLVTPVIKGPTHVAPAPSPPPSPQPAAKKEEGHAPQPAETQASTKENMSLPPAKQEDDKVETPPGEKEGSAEAGAKKREASPENGRAATEGETPVESKATDKHEEKAKSEDTTSDKTEAKEKPKTEEKESTQTPPAEPFFSFTWGDGQQTAPAGKATGRNGYEYRVQVVVVTVLVLGFGVLAM
ncbi:unnamed protein product [Vitrella brassicaformis CCMP3155]|uniref:Uncharacterized protein n=3 Tax=Vitrella brassicaformis TaxID=1169539 RepID=A0A0G4ECS1_VITBC|nr:unnamed protein product [Vitrella brassicaformis CCMP3155]|eukprot:CEL93345.1 unnamed protein product [Vitrella brassicaformis CCMP3155]